MGALASCCMRLPSRSSLPSFASVQDVLAAGPVAGACCRSDLGTEANEANEDFGEASTGPLRPRVIPAFLASSCRLSWRPCPRVQQIPPVGTIRKCPNCAQVFHQPRLRPAISSIPHPLSESLLKGFKSVAVGALRRRMTWGNSGRGIWRFARADCGPWSLRPGFAAMEGIRTT